MLRFVRFSRQKFLNFCNFVCFQACCCYLILSGTLRFFRCKNADQITFCFAAGNTCNRSTSREREIPNSESRHNLSSKTNASGAPSNSLTTDLIKPLSTSNPCSKPLKPSSLPSIRYHPYVTYERKKKEVCLENKMQESTKSPESKPFTLQCVSPSSSCNTWDVHSVTVPRNGGFTLNRPISNAQTLSNALPVGSDNKNDVATAGKVNFDAPKSFYHFINIIFLLT